MTNTSFHTLILRFARCVLALSAITTIAFNTSAQTTGQLDNQTPLALTPGAPAGSRAEDLATVNLFNGHLNFVLPLVNLSGRGEIKVPLALNIQRPWSVSTRCDLTSTGQTVCRRYADPTWWNGQRVGYGPGVMKGRGAVGNSGPIGNGVSFTFTDASGTEHELRDTLTNGLPHPNGIASFGRGTNFASIDGSSITFVSDSPVDDHPSNGSDPTVANGYLLLPDGTRYRVETGVVKWIRDRNGNKVTYSYEWDSIGGGFRVTTITDSVGRTITVSYDVNDPVYGLCDQITAPAFGAVSRIVTITKTSLSAALRYDLTQTQTYGQLFPQITNDVNFNTQFNPPVVSGVYLPNGQSIKFFYNTYGDLARIQVPEGGAVDFDYLGGITNEPSTGAVLNGNYIYRRVVTKRIYAIASDTSSTKTTTYSRPETWNPTTAKGDSIGYVITEDRAADNSLLSYEKHYFFGVAVNSFFSSNPYPAWKDGREYKTETLALNQTTVLKRVENEWRQRAPVSWWSSYVASRPFLNINDEPANDPRIVETTETIEPSGVNLVSRVTTINPQTQVVGFELNNQTDSWQYDYGVGAPSTYPRRHDHFDYLTVNSANSINYSGPANGSSYTASDPHVRKLVRARKVYSVNPTNGTETLVAQTDTLYDEPAYAPLTYPTVASWIDPGTARGNATTIKNWLNISGAWLESHLQYDQCGSVRKSWDPRDTAQTNPSQISYVDSFSDGLARNTYAFPTTVTTPIADQSGASGSNVAFVSSSVYDFNAGKATSATDPNGKTTTYDYNDPLNRLKQVTYPDNGRARYNYSDTPGNLYVQVLTDIDSSRAVETRNYLDGLGRQSRNFVYDGTTATPWIVIDSYYDAMGRVAKQSQPRRVSSANATLPGTCSACTIAAYDILGRVISVTTPDNAQVLTGYGASTTGVLGITSTVTDQAGRKRRTLVNALGHLVRVDEPNDTSGSLDVGGTSTAYTYDVMGNLRKVVQGAQQRFFLYDSIGRLLRTKNPEQLAGSLASNLTDEVTGNTAWSVAYSFDNNGNVISRIDARNVTTTYDYDGLGRLKTRSYSDGTPNVSFTYDATNVTNAKGRLTRITSSVATQTYDEYDAMGRIKAATQTIDTVPYLMGYSYDLAGMMTSQVYPSGRVVTAEYDEAGRLAGLKNQQTGIYYVGAVPTDETNRILYAPHGGISQMRLGNGLWEHRTYNSRLQPQQIGLGTAGTNSTVLQLDYNYGSSSNNGNLQSQTIGLPGRLTLAQSYTYDQLNRLQSAEELNGTTQSWKQSYSYVDQNGQNGQYGNRRFDTANSTPALVPENPVFDPATNRVVPQAGEQYTYDPAGNLTKDKLGHSFAYNAESKQISYNGGNPLTGGATYAYDGDGRRVKKISAAGTTTFVYNVKGQVVAQYSDTQSTPGGTNYLTADNIGTPRVITNSLGQVVGRHDYLPFGEEIPASYGLRSGVLGYPPSDTIVQRFTQKERDNESTLDYFLARYYSSGQGRFNSVDPEQEGASNDDPQSWNGYAYARSSPLVYTDPDGKRFLVCDPYGKNCTEVSDEEFWAERKELKKTGNQYTGSGDFFEYGRILNAEGGVVATYVQISIDDLGQQYIYAIRGAVDPIPKATAQFFGISLVAGTAGGAAVYALSTSSGITTLGLLSRAAAPGAGAAGGAAGVINQLSRTDQKIFQKAAELGASAQNAFMNNVQILRDALFRVAGPDKQINVIGKIGSSPIYGSIVSRIGIAEVNGTTVIVKVTQGNVEILGPLP